MIDLTNKAVATITNCDQEPIHIPGTIQPHGYLLAVTPQEGVVSHCSSNLTRFLGLPLPDILGKSIFDLFPEHRETFQSCLGEELHSRVLTLYQDEIHYHLLAHRVDDLTVLELEATPEECSDTIPVPQLLALVKTPGNLVDLCEAVAKEVQRMLGYNRVMIYRFDEEDHSGEVVAESLTADLEPYLGLRYPAGDIPSQARALYVRNTLRAINDSGADPVALFTLPAEDKGTSPKQLDLSHAYLRSVSPIHIKYLRNMGVGASFSISLVKDGRLWGLIACHHDKPRYPTLDQRNTAQMIGMLLSSQIDVLERTQQSAELLAGEAQLSQLLRLFEEEYRFSLASLVEKSALLNITGAQGAAILTDGQLCTQGSTPPLETIRELLSFLHQLPQANEGIVTKNLAGMYPAAAAYEASASGVIYHSLGYPAADCIIWFRPGLVQTITWGGKPKVPQADGVSASLTPRSSFSAWQQTVRDVSEPWSAANIQMASRFAFALRKQLRTLQIQQEAGRQRALNERLTAVNEELENINWISTHDLREPLRKIQLLASRALGNESQEASTLLLDSISRMHNSARRMQQLLDDISAYSIVSVKKDAMAKVSLDELLHEISRDKADDFKEQRAQLEVGELPRISGIVFQLKQLFMNLINNALKFGKPGESNLISVRVVPPSPELLTELGLAAQNYFAVAVQDNGIGFDPVYSRTIFKLFQRLSNEPDGQKGTGVGLAICKKIMLNHEGYIWAESTPSEGSTFYLIFPKSCLI